MRKYYYLLPVLVGLLVSCTKLTDVKEPPNRFDNPFQNDVTASSLMLGLYEKNLDKQCLYNGHMSRYGGLQGGELAPRTTGGDDGEFHFFRLKPNNKALPAFWSPAYECIARCNLLLQDLPTAPAVSSTLKPLLLGEAHFMRALSYFYLVNLFDSIPHIVGIDIGQNTQQPQVGSSIIYDQIVDDLETAIPLLPKRHPDTGYDSLRRTRIELGAAQALLARVYLYLRNYERAAYYASLVIDHGGYQLESLNRAFQYMSRESILQFKPVLASYNTAEAFLFLLEFNGVPNYELTNNALNSFDIGDQRKVQWTKIIRVNGQDKYQVRKYTIAGGQPRLEYNIVLRLAEQYLIRAEARARLNDTPGAIADLGAVRQRAGLLPPPENSPALQLLPAIARERQAELFTEWGHRLLDLHRWWALPTGDVLKGYADSILQASPNWQPYMRYWPIPLLELSKNPLLHQNEGY